MGYSCTQAANRVLDALTAECRKQTGSSNTWNNGACQYFYEVGRENADGAITGQVCKILDGVRENEYRRVGSFRIEPDGIVTRFPGLPSLLRKRLQAEGRAQQAFQQGALFYCDGPLT